MASIPEALRIALTHQQAGRLDLAEEIYRRVLAAEPGQADAQNNLGTLLRSQGKLSEAIDCYRLAIQSRPAYPEAINNLANALQLQDDFQAACDAYRQALELKPDYAEAWNNLGAALRAQGDLEESLACSRRAVELRPGLAQLHSNLGDALRDLGRPREAVACYEQALQLDPQLAEVHVNLGMALQDQGKLTQAATCYRRAIELAPDDAQAYNNLGVVLKEQGELDAAADCYLRALQLKPDFAAAESNHLLLEQFRPGVTPAGLAAAHAEWDERHAAPLKPAWRPPANDRDPERPLRLGFVSPDFGQHPVGWFLVRVIEELRSQPAETICYSDRALDDPLTARFQRAAGIWRRVHGWSHERLAEQIRADRIDILFDLAGHAGSTRLLVFARKPAPIQVTWMGYVGTTGLSAMDYLLADRWEVPDDCQTHYREQVLRLPDGYVCYEPPACAAEVSRLPALAAGHVTFGSFNNPAKLNASILEVWSRLLRRVPEARLALKYSGMDDPAVRRRCLAKLTEGGVDPSRVDLFGWSPHEELLAEYGRIDIALDTAPYSGGLTTCEALWMGVPVITCPGETFAGRHALSHLSNVGLRETIAVDFDRYVDLAVELAGDLDRLAAIRAGLRQRVAQSPLCDAGRFTVNLLGALRTVWRRWCA